MAQYRRLQPGEQDDRAIPKDKLKHGAYYDGYCRNAGVARWNANEQRFYHWRTKFGDTFIETIKCQEDEADYDVFVPLTETEFDLLDIKPIKFAGE